jgi:Cofactor assembly of complex C subunit B, CCB2/CCB4
MSKSDPNSILRLLPIVVGALAGTLLMVNRFLTPSLSASQSRSDALGIILSAVLILTGLLWQQIQPKLPDTVDEIKTELAWASHLLLTNTVTRSLVIYYQGKTLLRRGILGQKQEVTPGDILQRVMEKQKPIYLVSLKLYPGRVEFDYLPENTQGVICQPIGQHGALILGANAPRSYTKQDETWVAGIADKLENTLLRS